MKINWKKWVGFLVLSGILGVFNPIFDNGDIEATFLYCIINLFIICLYFYVYDTIYKVLKKG